MKHYNYQAIPELRKPFSESQVFDIRNRYSSVNNNARLASLVSLERSHSGEQSQCTLFWISILVGCYVTLNTNKMLVFLSGIAEFAGFFSKTYIKILRIGLMEPRLLFVKRLFGSLCDRWSMTSSESRTLWFKIYILLDTNDTYGYIFLKCSYSDG